MPDSVRGVWLMRKSFLSFAVVPLLSVVLFAQQPDANQQTTSVEPMDHTPVYRVKVLSRSTQAVNYRHHSGGTSLDFRGTDLMPEASGKAKVESRTGRIEINADFEHLKPSHTLAPEYLTYVLWAITPEGRPVSLGEIVPEDGKSSVRVSTDLQAFGMIVTAEPYFSVTRPSDMVVLENVVKANTKGWEQPIDTKFDVVERGQYTVDITAAKLPSTTADPKTPNDLLQARNAVAIAQAEGADHYAADTMRKAQDFLARAEDYLRRKQSGKAISTVARGAAQSAEDARVLTLQRRQQEQEDAERTAMRERAEHAQNQAEQAQQQEAEAKAKAAEEARQREQADRDRQSAEQAKADADRARQEAEAAKADALAQQQAAQLQAQQAEQARAQADQARLQAEQEKEQTRARLLQQLNQVLQTRESARGLIVDMPDVLFDTAKYTLKAGARERLAKVAGILMAYPDLHVQVEGHTDNVGGVEYNQQLSEKRAGAVREFLVQQGVKSTDIESRGFGMDQPVATNATATGRQLNRRVDLVVTGQAIGTTAGVANPGQPATSAPGPAGTATQPAMVPPANSNPQPNPATPPNNQPPNSPPQ
jgi:outer membrane protein OmpA-like peptidoglycan-associated protein